MVRRMQRPGLGMWRKGGGGGVGQGRQWCEGERAREGAGERSGEEVELR